MKHCLLLVFDAVLIVLLSMMSVKKLILLLKAKWVESHLDTSAAKCTCSLLWPVFQTCADNQLFLHGLVFQQAKTTNSL